MDLSRWVPWGTREKKNGNELAPKQGLQPLRTRFDQLIDEMFKGFETGLMPGGAWGVAFPRVDVQETEKEVVVTAEIPGVTEKDVEVLLLEGALRIRGEKKAEKTSDEGGMHITERSFGSFLRDVPLPAEVDEGKVEAAFKNGVLTVTLKKVPGIAPKKIAVKAS